MVAKFLDRALKAYFRRFGDDAAQPSLLDSYVDVENNTVFLVNSHGTLAAYHIRPNGTLTLLAVSLTVKRTSAPLLNQGSGPRGLRTSRAS